MHKVATLRGKGWPNIMLGEHRTLGGAVFANRSRKFLCRLELDTPLDETERNALEEALHAEDFEAAATIIADARTAQDLLAHKQLIKAALYREGPPDSDGTFNFSIRVEGLADYGQEPTMAKSLRLVMDIPVRDLPKAVTRSKVESKVRQGIGTNKRAKSILKAFLDGF